ncbi:2,3-bisphosphoglycerate-independent phosphoglycerate mutase [Ureaplasma miroungigenitalium]|uniref:2,3-bisphosphoglycerate-independent phosphoglycerate mutase n=1 Tax=Ureaplasma miroungigenitalium TaxID=1042321 RepID=A0ABT3BMH9_9BACT|nr:2,3-bisphosphoglycerate-independent phosphoglycerate mutase [Ureaplasma miroungigenitalium]MCV3728430.1 2,3-bisphosphoglycerate-independent phosphoglycerate mutase [Ureaplasma miroungigenitalium]MCV3734217.1 2,3-bisphosphoglycerate-independent phosphoglycerate mutase [Ureaplasma miroungigenitalium]
MMTPKRKKIALVILDGYGIAKDSSTNAITQAQPKFLNSLAAKYPSLKLHASGEKVGLKPDQFGNSEHGHMSIGAGRIIYTDNMYVNQKIKQPNFQHDLLDNIKGERVHLVGIYSRGQVHGNHEHILFLIRYLVQQNKHVLLHLIIDGRDTKPMVFKNHYEELNELIKDQKISIKSISGRYFAMDRDQRWERVQKAYNAMFIQHKQTDLKKFINDQQAQNISDEFVEPISLGDEVLQPNETVIITNYRADRILQLIHLLKPQSQFTYVNPQHIQPINIFSLTHLKQTDLPFLFSQPVLKNILDDVLQASQIKQARIAETEKYAHVTYFFDAQTKRQHPFKKFFHIPSPRVQNYEQTPGMSASLLTKTVKEQYDNFDFFVINYANADLLGHTGDLKATIKSIQLLDETLADLYDFFVSKKQQTMIITADHGNAEVMYEDNSICKSHTTNPVPFIITDPSLKLRSGDFSIAHIAATILDYWNLKVPQEMLSSMIDKDK